MTATDELRRLLDERGVEYEDELVKSSTPYRYGYDETYWGGDSFGYIEPIGAPPGTIGSHPELTIHNCTPEQAIAATLGCGECTNASYRVDESRFHCSECGFGCWVRNVATGRDELPAHCPKCGRKVVVE